MKSIGSFLIKFLSFIVFVLSLLSYYFAPADFNYSFIIWLFALFLINGFFSIKKDISDQFFFSFSVLYLISFFLVTFAYPLFIHETPLEILFMNVVDDKYIVRGTALCQLAFSSYVWGMSMLRINREIKVKHVIHRAFKINYLAIPIIGFMGLILGVFLMPQTSAQTINFDVGWAATIYSLFLTYAIIITHYSGKTVLYKKRIFLYSIIAVSGFLLLFVIQDRGLILGILVVCLSVYTFYIRRLQFYKILILLLIGVLVLSVIGDIRSKSGGALANLNEIGEADVVSNWERFNDLTSISRNIYEGYEYKETQGYFYPERFFLVLSAPIPFLPSVLTILLFPDKADTSTSDVLSKYTMAKTGLNDDGGLGTNSVIDLYMSWGVFGVIVMNIFLGYIIAKARFKMRDNLYYAIIYFVITSSAIYIPRATVYEPYRLIIWMLILTMLLQKQTFRISRVKPEE